VTALIGEEKIAPRLVNDWFVHQVVNRFDVRNL